MMARMLVLAALLVAALAAPARAQTCTIAATDLNFGSVDVLLNGQEDTTGSVSVHCTGSPNEIVRVCLNLGYPNASQPDAASRLALAGADTLAFQLFVDPSRRQQWGSWQQGALGGVEIDVPLNGDGVGASVQQTIYGRVFSGQSRVAPGRYLASFGGSHTMASVQYARGIPCAGLVSGNQRFPFKVVARVPDKCTVTAGTMDFGTRTSLTNAIDASTNLGIVCSKGLPYRVALDGGMAPTGNLARRRMTKGNEAVEYGLYRDPGRIQIWGDTPDADTLAGTGTGLTQTVPVYGRVPPQPTPSSGTYTDTVVVTVIY